MERIAAAALAASAALLISVAWWWVEDVHARALEREDEERERERTMMNRAFLWWRLLKSQSGRLSDVGRSILVPRRIYLGGGIG